MTTGQKSNNQNKVSEYDKIVQELRNKLNVHAKDYVPKMYEALSNDGYDADQAREKIEKDWLNVWTKRTIRDNLPKEAVREYKRETISNIDDKKIPIQVSTNGSQEPEQEHSGDYMPSEKTGYSFSETYVAPMEQKEEGWKFIDVSPLWRGKFIQCARDGIKVAIRYVGDDIVEVLDIKEYNKRIKKR